MNAHPLRRAGLLGAATATGQEILLRLTRGRPEWERTNFRGNTVNLAGGVTVALSTLAVAAKAPAGTKAPATLVTAVAAGTGYADDLAADPLDAKGFKGHLGALRRGHLTTGAAKLLGISSAALVGGGLIATRRGSTGVGLIADALVSGGVIAASANLMNLFDLRPGRTLKVAGIFSAALSLAPGTEAGKTLAADAGAITAGALPRDLGEAAMLGDVGANSLGALLGLAAAHHPSPKVRTAILAAAAGLILASEKVSFSRVIERTPALAWFDRLGRQ